MTSHDTAPAGRAAAPARASLAWRAAEAARMGWLEYRVVETPAGLLGATLPRGVLQILFFTTLAGVLAGPGHREYAFAGSLVLVLSGTNVNGVVAVPVLDKQYATFARVRPARCPRRSPSSPVRFPTPSWAGSCSSSRRPSRRPSSA